MSGYRSRRTKLKNHDKGINRHNRGLAWIQKRARLGQQNGKRQPKKGEA